MLQSSSCAVIVSVPPSTYHTAIRVRLCVWGGAPRACGRHLEHCSLLASRACTAPPNFARTRGLVSVSELQWLRDRNVLSCLYAAQGTVLEACPALPS